MNQINPELKRFEIMSDGIMRLLDENESSEYRPCFEVAKKPLPAMQRVIKFRKKILNSEMSHERTQGYRELCRFLEDYINNRYLTQLWRQL